MSSKIKIFMRSNYIGSLMHTAGMNHITLATGWVIPVLKVNKPTHGYEVHLLPKHNCRHPSLW